MKSKAAVVALCVCVILAVLGVVLGKSPALENTELPPSVSEKILSSQEISSESEASSAEVSTPAKTTTPKEEYKIEFPMKKLKRSFLRWGLTRKIRENTESFHLV